MSRGAWLSPAPMGFAGFFVLLAHAAFLYFGVLWGLIEPVLFLP